MLLVVKDSEIPSDAEIIEWAAQLITDLAWIQVYEARGSRNFRFFQNMAKLKKQLEEVE